MELVASERRKGNKADFTATTLDWVTRSSSQVVNGRERPGFEDDIFVRVLGGPERVRAAKRRLRGEGIVALFDPSLFRAK